MIASLAYHEPDVVTILTQASFLLLLNVGNFVLDRLVFCGLLGQIFLGVAWGTPGAKWLSSEAEHVIVQLGYLGLLLIVYKGGLETSLRSLHANLWLSACVAITGIAVPIGLSFVLQSMTDATALQAFAAGAALCSTSLGTAFTVLSSSGLMNSRLGVVITSAAMMDDVIGLVMVQVISNLGESDGGIGAVTIVRPVLVSIAFAISAPIICKFIIRPVTLWLNMKRAAAPKGRLNRLLTTCSAACTIHTLTLIGFIAGSTYAGTSNLYAAYIAGTCISWWDAEVPHPVLQPESASQAEDTDRTSASYTTSTVNAPTTRQPSFSGLYTFERYYEQPLERVLGPFFFASIGFSIPITEMFHSPIVWKGIVYALLMAVGKIACGLWLLRLPKLSFSTSNLIATLKRKVVRSCRSVREKPTSSPSPQTDTTTPPTASDSPAVTQPEGQSIAQATPAQADATQVKPRSIYPASILGCAMTARGEIGSLISSIAESNGIYSNGTSQAKDGSKSSDTFLVVTWAIMLCTILGPLAVGLVVRRVKRLQQGVEKEGRVIRGDVLGVWGVS